MLYNFNQPIITNYSPISSKGGAHKKNKMTKCHKKNNTRRCNKSKTRRNKSKTRRNKSKTGSNR
jgi:hypothetical protein